jgi:hypothetical protein
LDINETLYNYLISLENINEFYEGENEELDLIYHDAILDLRNEIDHNTTIMT